MTSEKEEEFIERLLAALENIALELREMNDRQHAQAFGLMPGPGDTKQ